jgi:hypothetical protein
VVGGWWEVGGQNRRFETNKITIKKITIKK